MKNKSLLKGIESKIGVAEGTAIFMLSTLLIKLLGGIYKIPLCNLLGSKGMGLYQMVFPVYSLAITLACGGLPTAMTQIIAKGYNAKSLLKKCIKIFVLIALVLCFVLLIFSKKIATMQGDSTASSLYYAIAPAIVAVALISCFRGYFQGKSNFKPTAFSQTVEQLVKCVSGVIALLLISGSVQKRAFFACLAVTFSEIIAFSYMLIKYRKTRCEDINEDNKKEITLKELFLIIAPIACSVLFFPLATFADSFIVINSLKNTYFEKATEVYGVYSGGVDTVISLPVSLLHNLSLGFLPLIVKDNKNDKGIVTVFILSIVWAICTVLFAPLIVRILFGGIKEYSNLLILLIRYASINIVALSTLQATNCYLVGISKQRVMLISMPIGVVIKIIANLTLVKMPQINVFGMIISDFGCYFVALLINLLYIIYINKKESRSNENYPNRSWHEQKRAKSKCN
ncbi:MAG: oligosaccharide flippase family protein [Clostridia bacterium]|nr:oligosaccharide flippase family protein [Clostridia bacterium]